MKFNLKTPCKECPFRTDSIPGYLGPWTDRAMLQHIGTSEFPCHLTLRAGDTFGENSPRAAFCAGAALHMNAKHQVSRLADVAAYQATLKGSAAQDTVFQSSAEFCKYHNEDDLVTQLTVFLVNGRKEVA